MVDTFGPPKAYLEPSWLQVAILSIFKEFFPLLGASWAYLGRVLGLSWLLLGPIWTHLVAVFFSPLAALVFPPITVEGFRAFAFAT